MSKEYFITESGRRGVRNIPWYKLGTNISSAKTVDEALELSGLNYTVKQQTISTEGMHIPGFVANVRSSDNKVLGIVTPKYTPVQNGRAFDFVNELAGAGFEYINAGDTPNGKKVWMVGKLPEFRILDDEVDNYICFMNSHDGGSSVKVCLTPIRVACSNALSMTFRKAKRIWSTTHAGDIEYKMSEAQKVLFMSETYNKELAAQAEILATTKISDFEINQLVARLFPIDPEASDKTAERAVEKRNAFMACLNEDDLSNFKNTHWGVLNAAADYATHPVNNRHTVSTDTTNWMSIVNGNNVLIQTQNLLNIA